MIAPLQGPSSLRPLLFRMSKPAYILRPDPGATQVSYISAFQQFYHWPYLGVFYAHMRHHKPHCCASSSRTFIATNLLIRAPHARSFEDSSGVTNAILAIYDRRPAYQDCCANTGPFCRLHRASHPDASHKHTQRQRTSEYQRGDYSPSNRQFSEASYAAAARAFPAGTHRTIAVIAIP